MIQRDTLGIPTEPAHLFVPLGPHRFQGPQLTHMTPMALRAAAILKFLNCKQLGAPFTGETTSALLEVLKARLTEQDHTRLRLDLADRTLVAHSAHVSHLIRIGIPKKGHKANSIFDAHVEELNDAP